MMEELASTRERLAVLANDVESLDRVLERLGYEGDVVQTLRVSRVWCCSIAASFASSSPGNSASTARARHARWQNP